MRHRIKKIPNLSTLLHCVSDGQNLLHSDKSTYTYFYKDKPSNDKFSDASDLNSSLSTKRGVLAARRYGCEPPLPRSWRCGRFLRKGRVGSLRPSTIPLVLASFALLLVLGLMIFPVGVGGERVYAETPAEECAAGKPVLALDMTGDVNLSKSVDDDIANNAVSYLSKDFTVTACRTQGYKVYVQANSNKLQNQEAPDVLFGVGENVSPNNFADNTWGYAIAESSKADSSLQYSTMPEVEPTKTESYTTDKSTGGAGAALKISFAAKFGKDKVAGHYTSNVLLSVLPNEWDVLDVISGETTMQEFAKYPTVCSNMAVGDQIQLVDDRTTSGLGKTIYWVGKLKDGNCWMTQNLDLPLSVGTTLKPEDTNVPSVFTFSDLGNYYNPGTYIYKPSSATAAMPSTGCHIGTVITCTAYFEVFNGSIPNNTDTHYLVGDYYPYNTANASNTRGSNVGAASGNGDICPKGWKLPTSFVVSVTGSDYGTLRHSPQYLVPAGRYSNGADYDDVGKQGGYWTSIPNGNDANAFTFTANYAGTSSGTSQTFAQSIRCLTTGS